MLKPYSCSYTYYSNKEYNVGCFYGFDCVIKLIELIKQLWENKIVILLGFNNSKFDNFCLIE